LDWQQFLFFLGVRRFSSVGEFALQRFSSRLTCHLVLVFLRP